MADPEQINADTSSRVGLVLTPKRSNSGKFNLSRIPPVPKKDFRTAAMPSGVTIMPT